MGLGPSQLATQSSGTNNVDFQHRPPEKGHSYLLSVAQVFCVFKGRYLHGQCCQACVSLLSISELQNENLNALFRSLSIFSNCLFESQ